MNPKECTSEKYHRRTIRQRPPKYMNEIRKEILI